MKKIVLFSGVFMLFALITACGSHGNKQNKTSEKEIVTSDEVVSEHSTSTSETATQTSSETAGVETNDLVARFVKFSPSTSGSIFIFEDKNGEEHWFHKARDAKGMDFAMNMEPGIQPGGYENVWFDVTYENREVERAGETKTEATIVNVERRENPDAGKQPAFTAQELKNAVFSGTEPFWSLYFKDGHILRVSPSGEATLYYVKDGLAAQHTLEEVIVPVSPMVVEIQVTDEAMISQATITLIREACSDGMSERDYPYTISIDIEGGESTNGCGRVDE